MYFFTQFSFCYAYNYVVGKFTCILGELKFTMFISDFLGRKRYQEKKNKKH